jgi:hypothetical protein
MGLEAQEVHHGGNEMNRRNFLKAAAAAVLGLVAGAKGTRESVVEQTEPSGWVVVIDEAGLDDAEVRWIVERVNLLYPVYVDLYGEESGVFQGLDHLITTGYQECLSEEFKVVRGDCGSL